MRLKALFSLAIKEMRPLCKLLKKMNRLIEFNVFNVYKMLSLQFLDITKAIFLNFNFRRKNRNRSSLSNSMKEGAVMKGIFLMA